MGASPKGPILNKNDIKFNADSTQNTKVGHKNGFSQAECQLIDNLWEICAKLSSHHNSFI